MSSDRDKISRQGVLFCGVRFNDNDWTYREQPVSDFGIDAHAETKIQGRPTGRLVALQIKSGRSWFRETYSDGWIYRPSEEHKIYWLNYSLPVILVLVDYDKQAGYWVEVSKKDVISTGKNYKIQVPNAQQLDAAGFAKLREIATAEIPTERKALSPGSERETFETEDFQWLPQQTPSGLQYNLYPKSDSALPEFSVNLTEESKQKFKNFLEKGTGDIIEGYLSKANFLPRHFGLENARVEIKLSDRSSPDLIPVIFDWNGGDGYHYQREFTLQCRRYGTKETLLETTMDQRDSLRILIDTDSGKAGISFELSVAGNPIGRALETSRFFVSAATGLGELEIVLQETGKSLIKTTWRDEFDYSFRFIKSYDLIKKYEHLRRIFASLPLIIPKDGFSDSETSSIVDIYEIVTKGALPLGNCTVTLPVALGLYSKLQEEVHGAGNFAVKHETYSRELCNQRLDLGPTMTVINEPLIIEDQVCGTDPTVIAGETFWKPPMRVPIRSKTGEIAQFFEAYLNRT